MSTPPVIAQPILKVVLENEDGTATEYTVKTDNRDAVRFDMTRARMHWPDGQSAPVLWMTFQAWSALKRSGQPVPVKVEDFLDRCIQCLPITEDGDELGPGDEVPSAVPTLPGPELG